MIPVAKRGKWIILLKCILAGLILMLLVKTSQLNLHLLTNITRHTGLFASFILIIFTIVFITAWRWHLLSDVQQISLGLTKTIKPAYIAGAFNTLLPGSVGGDFIRCHYVCQRIPERKSSILLTIFFDRLIGLIGILSTLCLAGLLHISYIAGQPKLITMLLILLTGCVGLITFIMSLMLIPPRFSLSAWLRQCFAANAIVLRIATYLEVFQQYRIPTKVLVKSVIISIIVEYLLVMGLLIIAAMIGMPLLDFSQVVLALGMTLLVSVIPVTPGGIGVGEMAFANILLLFNPGSMIAYATIFLAYRLLSMVAYLPALLFYVPKIKWLHSRI
jgi:uncharacterized protein (TIRG00374 family)